MASTLFNQTNQVNTQPGQLQLTPEMIQQLNGYMNLIENSSNPTALISNMIASNPNMKQYATLLNGNYKEAVMQMAKAKGIDVNQLEAVMTQYLQNRGK